MAQMKRVQMLLEPEQHRRLQEAAKEQGKSVAEVTREAIDAGLEALRSYQVLAQQKQALERARILRESFRKAHGGPLDIDVVADINEMREERIDQIAPDID